MHVAAGAAYRRECAAFLRDQVLAIRPRVIATLGSPAMLVLKAASEDLRGRWHGYTTLRALDGAQPSAALAGHVRFGSRWSCAASWRWDTPVLGPARASIAAGAGRAPMRRC